MLQPEAEESRWQRSPTNLPIAICGPSESEGSSPSIGMKPVVLLVRAFTELVMSVELILAVTSMDT